MCAIKTEGKELLQEGTEYLLTWLTLKKSVFQWLNINLILEGFKKFEKWCTKCVELQEWICYVGFMALGQVKMFSVPPYMVNEANSWLVLFLSSFHL